MKKIKKKDLAVHKVLVKLQKQQINELRINLKKILDQTEELEQALEKIDQTQEQALHTISTNIHLGFTFSELQNRLNTQKNTISKKINSLQEQEDQLRDELANGYRSLKTAEIIGDKSKQQYQKQLDSEEIKHLDDITAKRQ